MPRLIAVTPLDGYRLRLKYDDRTEGEVDLSGIAGRGVFAAWNDAAIFSTVKIGPHGQLRWTEDVELCADAMYLKITSKSVEAVFPNLRTPIDA